MAPPASCVALWIDCFFHFVAAAFFCLNGNPGCAATPEAIAMTELLFDDTRTGEEYACVMGFHLYGMLRLIIGVFSLCLTTGPSRTETGAFVRRALVAIILAIYHAASAQYVSRGVVADDLKDSSIVLHASLSFILVAGPVAELLFGGEKSESPAKRD